MISCHRLCKKPTIPDPYESSMVEVRNSAIPGAQQGLFALKNIDPNTVLSFYNGIRANPAEFNPDTWDHNGYKIFDPANMPHGTIDIPPWAQVK